MIKHVFGPVPSRRLGQSLGIDPVPLKTCNWNCVYCQLGRTKHFSIAREYFFSNEEILHQVEEALSTHANSEIDWVTFVGSGETTLHAGLGALIRGVKQMTALPVAVITNGSFLYLPEVRQELLAADAVLPTLDAGNDALYRKINRPHPQFIFERLIKGLVAFRKEYHNSLWVEVMLLQGLNDGKEALEEIAKWLEKIAPDEVHIVQPTRPPVEKWVNAPDQEGLLRAQSILGEVARLVLPAMGSFSFSSEDNLVDAIVGIITRHPMRESELIDSLTAWSASEVQSTLDELRDSGRVQVVTRHDARFWSASEAYYPNNNKG
jgi:wyosine [tRNA(Phe)-imidazoG37] synthetase (radical SAM superfamily)